MPAATTVFGFVTVKQMSPRPCFEFPKTKLDIVDIHFFIKIIKAYPQMKEQNFKHD